MKQPQGITVVAVAVAVAALTAGCSARADEPVDGQAATARQSEDAQHGAADHSEEGPQGRADNSEAGQLGAADIDPFLNKGIGVLDHVLMATAVVDIDVVSVAPFDPEVDEEFPTITAVVTHAVSGDIQGLGLDATGPIELRVLSTAALEPGGTYRAFVNSSPASDTPLRIGFALTPDGDPAPGYDDDAAVAALDRIVTATGKNPTGALLELLASSRTEEDPVVRALFDLGPESTGTDLVEELLALPSRERSLPQLEEEIAPGLAAALGVEFVHYEVAFESAPKDVEALALHFPNTGLLGWSAVPDDGSLFGIIGFGPANRPFEVLGRGADGSGRTRGTFVAATLAPGGDGGRGVDPKDVTFVARATEDGSVELERVTRLQFDEFVEANAVAPMPPETEQR